MNRTVRSYDYVNQPYLIVREAMLAGALDVFRRATAAAAQHVAMLHVELGPFEVGAGVAIRILEIVPDVAYGAPATRLKLSWSAAKHPGLFPEMEASLVVFALSSKETQLELEGTYTPPLGALGKVLDAAVGHRLAEASVVRFIHEVAEWLRGELAGPRAAAPVALGR